MENAFEKYIFYKKEGEIIDVNTESINLIEESFLLFKDLFDSNYGSIQEHDNLISIHTGGWSENEYLIDEFKETLWWLKYHKITAKGGHYYFNTDVDAEKVWKIKPF